MIHFVLNCLSIIVVVVVYSSYTHGYVWQYSSSILDPRIQKTCKGWMHYHGFDNDLAKNSCRAFKREKIHDPEVSVFAATYAYFLSSFPQISQNPEEYLPSKFCQHFEDYNKKDSFLALKNAKMSCEDWIISYGYKEEDPLLNFAMAKNRRVENDPEMHIWVAKYSSYLEDFKKPKIKPSEFCRKIGKEGIPKPKKLPFVRNGTLKTCEEWIVFSDYTDIIIDNIRKAVEQDKNFEIYLSKWTVLYIHHLQKFENEKIGSGCCNNCLKSKPKKPAAFCKKMHHSSKLPVYFHS